MPDRKVSYSDLAHVVMAGRALVLEVERLKNTVLLLRDVISHIAEHNETAGDDAVIDDLCDSALKSDTPLTNRIVVDRVEVERLREERNNRQESLEIAQTEVVNQRAEIERLRDENETLQSNVARERSDLKKRADEQSRDPNTPLHFF